MIPNVTPAIRRHMKMLNDLRLERDGANFSIDMHRETCRECGGHSLQYIRTEGKCTNGMELANNYFEASQRLMGASMSRPV